MAAQRLPRTGLRAEARACGGKGKGDRKGDWEEDWWQQNNNAAAMSPFQALGQWEALTGLHMPAPTYIEDDGEWTMLTAPPADAYVAMGGMHEGGSKLSASAPEFVPGGAMYGCSDSITDGTVRS